MILNPTHTPETVLPFSTKFCWFFVTITAAVFATVTTITSGSFYPYYVWFSLSSSCQPLHLLPSPLHSSHPSSYVSFFIYDWYPPSHSANQSTSESSHQSVATFHASVFPGGDGSDIREDGIVKKFGRF